MNEAQEVVLVEHARRQAHQYDGEKVKMLRGRIVQDTAALEEALALEMEMERWAIEVLEGIDLDKYSSA